MMGIHAEHGHAQLAQSRVVSSSALKTYWFLFLTVNFLLLLPVWWVQYVPMVDYPSHLARMNILYHHNDISAYAHAYDVKWEPIPNLAMDVVVPFLMRFADVYTAGKIFISLSILMFSFGCHYFAVSIHKKPSWIVPLLCFLNFNLAFLMGFLNYIFGFALFLITFAFWNRHCRKENWTALIAMTVLTAACYFAHLSSYSFLAAAVGLMFLQQWFLTRKLTTEMILSLLPLCVPVVVFFAFMKGSGRVGEIEWSGVFDKVKDVVFMVRTYNHVFDGIVVIAGLAVLLTIFHRAYAISCRRDVLFVGAAFFLFFIVCPKTLFTSWAADIRFLLPAMVLIALSFEIALPRKIGHILIAGLFVLALARHAEVFYAWNKRDQTIASEVRLFEHLPERVKIFPLVFDEEAKTGNKIWQRTIRHSISYATITRGTITPSLFAIPGQQPIRLREQLVRGLQQEEPIDSVNWPEVFRTYDYIFCSYVTPDFSELIRGHCECVASTGNFAIYRIVKRDGFADPVAAQDSR